MAHQLRDIRAAVARLCNDWVRFVATEDSAATTTFVDWYTAYENDAHFRGSDLWFRDDAGTAANRGLVVRVLDSEMDTYTLTLGPGLTDAPVTGDEAWAFNIGGMGTRLRTYDATINDAITGLGEAAHPVYVADLPDAWDREVAWVDIPEEFTHVATALYQGSDDNWYEVPSHGIVVDPITKQFAIAPEYADLAHGQTVRLRGLTAPTPLVDDTDETAVDYEWLTTEAAGQLLLNQRDQLKVNKGGMLKNQADALRGKAGGFALLEGMVRVR